MTHRNPLNIIISIMLLLMITSLIYFLRNEFISIEQLKIKQNKEPVAISTNSTEIATENNRIIPELSEYDEIVKRPLFNDDRLPFVYVAPEKTESKKKRTSAKKPVEQYRLNAVVITPDKQIAIIQTSKKRELLRVAIGESIDNWTLSEVTDHAVQLKNGNEIKTLELEIKASVNKQTSTKNKNKTPINNKNAKTDAIENMKKGIIQAKKENLNIK